MQINYQQFDPEKMKSSCPLYLFTGDEPLLLQEGRDRLKLSLKQQGYTEIQSVDTAINFNWDCLFDAAATQSLFSERKIIDIHHNNAKFDNKAQKQLLNYIENPNPDVVVIIRCAKLSAAQKKAKWLQKLSTIATVITVWPISAKDLPRWIQQRLKQNNITATHDSIQLLSHFTEGNLLATHQAIEKLRLLNVSSQIDIDDMKKVISNNARFNVFDFSQYALAGNTSKVKHSLRQLKDSGAEPILILWALSRDLRDLYKLLHCQSSGKNPDAFLRTQWKTRQQQLKQAAGRCNLKQIEQLIQQAHQCDQIIKGYQQGDTFRQLEAIAFGIGGMSTQHL